VIDAVAAASFAFNWHANQISAQEAFYLPHARFWELMLGALLAHASLRASSANISSLFDSAMSLS
jgi:peptidoglycan/LPS O-acetylase OafA/YrhL